MISLMLGMNALKCLAFTKRKYDGTGVPRLKHQIETIQASWGMRIFTSKAYWLILLPKNISTPNIKKPNQLFSYGDKVYSTALTSGNNIFWSNVDNIIHMIFSA